MLRKIIFFLLTASCAAQVPIGGRMTIGGQSQWGTPSIIIPPPPPGISASLFGAGWNKTPPAIWPPTDSLTHQSSITIARMWDDGVKLGQIATVSGTVITYTAAFTTLSNFLTTTIPAYPMDVLYTFGDTPTGYALGTDAACATPTSSSCVPPNDIDNNSASCNADGSASALTVHADCGNGMPTNGTLWDQMVFHIVTTFKGKIKYYECWNEPDGAGNFWSNAAAYGGKGHAPDGANQPPLVRLVRLCADAAQIIHQVDPSARLVGPSFHGPTALTWMHYFATTTVNQPACTGACSAALGGVTWPAVTISGAQATADGNIFHGRGSGSGSGEGPGNAFPENFLQAYNNAATEIANDHLTTILFDDEWGCVNQSSLQCPTSDYNAYFVAVGEVLRASVTNPGVQRQMYYQFDAAGGGGSVSLQGTIAGTAWNTMAGWLTSATNLSCAQVGSVWTCPLKLNGITSAEIKWNAGQTTVSTITGASSAVGGNTTYTCSGGCGGLAGEYVTIDGFSNAGNDVSCTVISSGSGSFVCNNPTGAAETHSASMSFTPVTCGTSCSLASSDGFIGTWTDLTGTPHPIVAGQVPLGAKPILIQ